MAVLFISIAHIKNKKVQSAQRVKEQLKVPKRKEVEE